MRLRHTLLFLVPLLLGPSALLAQGRVIRGIVVDSSSGAPIAAANISVRGTTLGAATGADGRFVIANAPEGAAPLVVRRIGYRARELSVGAGQSEVRVAMASDPLQLDAVVVSGQATAVERRNLPTAVATVSGEEVARVSSQSVEHALQ